ncbi:MAG: sugar phosphate nucleotidyltransferase [Candidatus Nitrosotenuis sp.]
MKCVLTVGGLGTRLLPLTKEIPKEMLPIYNKSKDGKLVLKPILQVIFESLHDYKIRDFCFVVGRTKRAVEDHFTPNYDLLNQLKHEKKKDLAGLLDDFFKKLKHSNIMFVSQPKPIGFGDAIEWSKSFVGKDHFLLHAGDDIVISKNNMHLKRLEANFKKYKADMAFLIEDVNDPSQYGVVNGPLLEKGIIDVKEMVEKPKKPRSKHAVIAIYLFKPKIFNYLALARKKSNPQNQLAEAFNMALKNGDRIIGVLLQKGERRIDIGTPQSYSKVLVSLK